jgi:hypothetical protein
MPPSAWRGPIQGLGPGYVTFWFGMINGDVVQSVATERHVDGVWQRRVDWPPELESQSAPMRMGLKPGDINSVTVRRGSTLIEFRYKLMFGPPN